MEVAPRGRVDRRRDIALKNDALRLAGGIRMGDRRQKRLSVGVQRRLVKVIAIGKLVDSP